MPRTRTLSYLLALALGAGATLTVPALHGDATAEAGKKSKKKAKKAAPKKAAIKLTADQKKSRAELVGSFQFGMTPEQVIGVLSKQLDERYAEKIAETQDVYKQDKLRKEKKKEIKRVKSSKVDFKGQRSGWDVSIIDKEFKHGTDESMLEYWENQGGKNQRRFFFFQDGELYKMVIQIDTTQFEEDQRSFEFFANVMRAKFGDDVTDAEVTYKGYKADPVFVKAVDKVRFYDAFVLMVLDPARASMVDQVRADRIHDVKEENNIVKSITDDGDDPPDLDANKDAVKGVIGDKKSK